MSQTHHPEGHPDDDDSIRAEESLRILEGFLEPARLASMLNKHHALMEAGQQAVNMTASTPGDRAELALLQQIFTSLHMSSYNLIVLAIGLSKRLEHVCERLDQLVDPGGEEWTGPEQAPETP